MLSGQGEASGVAIAGAVLARYRTLAPDERRAFLAFLAETVPPDGDALASAAKASLQTPMPPRSRRCTGASRSPSTGFFDRVIVEAGCPADQVLYVGDRLDNDIRPAQEAGIATALIRRGPWGYVLTDPTVSGRCLFRVESLAELPDLVRKHNVCQLRGIADLVEATSVLICSSSCAPWWLSPRTGVPPDPFEPGAVPVGAEHGERLAEVVGRAVAVVAVRVARSASTTLRCFSRMHQDHRERGAGDRKQSLVAGGEGGIAGEGVQPSSVVEVEPSGAWRRNQSPQWRDRSRADSQRRCRRDLDLGGYAVQPGPDYWTDSMPGVLEGRPEQSPCLVRLAGEGGDERHVAEDGSGQRMISGVAGGRNATSRHRSATASWPRSKKENRAVSRADSATAPADWLAGRHSSRRMPGAKLRVGVGRLVQRVAGAIVLLRPRPARGRRPVPRRRTARPAATPEMMRWPLPSWATWRSSPPSPASRTRHGLCSGRPSSTPGMELVQ